MIPTWQIWGFSQFSIINLKFLAFWLSISQLIEIIICKICAACVILEPFSSWNFLFCFSWNAVKTFPQNLRSQNQLHPSPWPNSLPTITWCYSFLYLFAALGPHKIKYHSLALTLFWYQTTVIFCHTARIRKTIWKRCNRLWWQHKRVFSLNNTKFCV